MMRNVVTALGMVLASVTICPAANPEKPLRLVFITCCRDEAFFAPVKQGMHDAAKMLGVQCEFIGTEGVDLKAQAEMVRKAVAGGCDGIALNIIDPVALDAVVEEAVAKGVPVVAFNVDDNRTPNARLAAVAQDFYQAGRTLGTHVAEVIPAGSTVLATQHDHGISALDDRLRGIQDALKEKNIRWKVVCSTNDPAKAVEVIAAELRRDAEIKFVLGTGLTDTEAAGHAIERYFPGRGCVAAGFDLTPELLRMIKSGVVRFSIDQQPYIQGFYPVVQLTLYRRYGIRPSNVDAGATVITAKEADQVLELTRRRYR